MTKQERKRKRYERKCLRNFIKKRIQFQKREYLYKKKKLQRKQKELM